MRNYYRWTALVSAAVLTLSSPVQVLADIAEQGGSTIDTAVVVPSAPLDEETKVTTVPGENAGGGSVAEGLAESGSGSITVSPVGFTGQETADGGNGTVSVGSVPAAESSGTGTSGMTQGTGTTEVSGAAQGTGTTEIPGAAQGTGTEKPSGVTQTTGTAETTKDFSRGPGFSYEEPEPEPEPETQVPVVQTDDILPIPNPVQVLPSQPIRGMMAADGSVALADVSNSIVQVTDKYCYDQMVLDISLLKVRYGDKLHIREMGESLDNRKIYDCIIGNVQAPKHILIQGGIHAREYMNPLMMMQQMELILANYDTGSFHNMPLSEMFNYVAVHFVPMTNPDGISISQFGPDAIRSPQLKEEINQCYLSDLARGKAGLDTASYYSHWKANARGVDLNLNFDALWEEIGAGIPSSSGFRGLMPASEPETQAMINLYNNPDYPWSAVIHYHSMGNVIYWDIRGNKVREESLEFAQLMSKVTGGYRILPSSGGGGFKDWIQLSLRPVPSVTLETGSVSCPIPVAYYGGIWSQNFLTWAYAMEWVATR